MKSKLLKAFILLMALIVAIIFIAPKLLVKFKGEDTLNIVSGLIKQRLGMDVEMESNQEEGFVNVTYEGPIEIDENIIGFEEIGESLGEGGLSANAIVMRGVTTFDANGDGLQDLYVPNNGRPVARPMDESGVLQMDERMPAIPSTLYMNQGNDSKGNPIYKSTEELIISSKNDKYVMEELLPENKFKPRKNTSEDKYAPGRIGRGALAADFNGDGKVDLLLLNAHYGTPFTVPGFGMRFYPGANYMGRKDKADVEYVESHMPEFLIGDMKDGINVTYMGEKEGQNVLLLNMGDKDKDGLPEWKDVSTDIGFDKINYHSTGATVADLDRDGDLDLYIGNFLDPDFWGFGAETFAGNRNELWLNQLSETGKFDFKELAIEYKCSGLFKEENLDSSLPRRGGKDLEDSSISKYKGQQIGEHASHTWAVMFADVNNDNYPDLIAANDIPNKLRIYINQEGKGFKHIDELNDPKYIGCWMGLAFGDLNNDRKSEMMVGGCGGPTFSIRNTALFLADLNEMNIQSLCQINAMDGNSNFNHLVLNFDEKTENFKNIASDVKVQFNEYTAPDSYHKYNIHPIAHKMFDSLGYNNTLNGTEFSWNPSFFDIDNDKDLDVYLVGSLNRGNDNFIGDWSAGVGRLLVNKSTQETFQFEDRTLEYRLFDIKDLDYDANPPRKAAPGTGWHKEDYVYFTDRDSYSGQGLDASENSQIKDIFRMHETANGNIASDLNNDGRIDIVVPHGGGYNSLSTKARNLKIDFMGKALAVPPPNKIMKAPTTFEHGETFVYINKNETENNWVKLNLVNSDSNNLYAIGAKVIINDDFQRTVVLGGQTGSAVHEPMHIGLGADQLTKVEVHWPDGDQTPQIFNFSNQELKKTITLKRNSNNLIAGSGSK